MGFWDRLIDRAGKKNLPTNAGERFIGRMNTKGEVEAVPDPSYMRPVERQTAETSISDLETQMNVKAEAAIDALQKLESDEAQGEEIAEHVKYKAEEEARAYGNIAAAFRTSSGEAPERIRAMIDKLSKTADESTGYAREVQQKAIMQLRELL